MFGFGKKKKEHDVRLTEEELEQLKKNMTRSERQEFERRQRKAKSDRYWDAMCMEEDFFDD